MRKIIIFINIVLLCVVSATAQTKDESRDKIKALKIAYITEQLNLTTEEAQKFWPIYNLYDKEQHTIRNHYKSSLRNSIKSIEEIDN